MSFAENLIYIRQHYSVTQEALAEQLGVSRQTVSKWEAGINFPETDKLIQLCDLYSTNLDDLMRGSVKIANLHDTELYDAHMNRFTRGIVIGVMLLIVGIAMVTFLEGIGFPENISTAAMLAFIVVGVLIILVSGLNHTEFKRKHADIEPSYPDGVLDRFGRTFTVLMAVGVGILMIAVILLIAFTPEEGDFLDVFGVTVPYMTIVGAFFLLISAGVGTIIYACMQKSKYDCSEFTYIAAAGTMPSNKTKASRTVSPEEMKRNQIVGGLCGAIMLCATMVFFIVGFSDGGYIDGPLRFQDGGFAYAWIAFPVGGLLCAVVCIIGSIFSKSKEDLIAEARKEDPWIKIDKGDSDSSCNPSEQ